MFKIDKLLLNCFLVAIILFSSQQQVTAQCHMYFTGGCNGQELEWSSAHYSPEGYWVTFTTASGETAFNGAVPDNSVNFLDIGVDVHDGMTVVIKPIRACNTSFPELEGIYGICGYSGSLGKPTEGFAAVAYVPAGKTQKREVFNNVNVQPNPFRTSVELQYELTQQEQVTVNIYNMRGQTVATLVENEVQPVGTHQLKVNLKDLPAGVYYYTLQTPSSRLTKKLMKLSQ